MGQRPIIRGDTVVNVVEIDDDCACMTKAEHKQMFEAEDADYAQRFAAWRALGQARHAEIQAAKQKAFMARGVAGGLRAHAEAEANKRHGNADAVMRRVRDAEKEAEDWRVKVNELESKPLPPKPKMVRAKRWFHPDDVIVGPAGGNIGDRWDGRKYTRPAQ